MYNEELKKRFISYHTKSGRMEKFCISIFNKVAKYEEQWNADVCSVKGEDLQKMINDITGGLRSRSQLTSMVVLRAYANYCIREGVPHSCDGLLRIDAESIGLGTLRFRRVSFPITLQNYLDEICSPESLKATDSIYRCFYWLAYMGMKEQDILSLKTSDVNFEKLIVEYNGKTYDIYKEAIPALKNCVELTSFYFNHPCYKVNSWKDRAQGDSLLRGIKGVLSQTHFRTSLAKATFDYTKSPPVKKTKMQLSYHRVWISGVFYRMYEQEISGREVNFEAIAAEFMEGKVYNFEKSGGKNYGIRKREIARDFFEDYQRWKLAFSL